LPGERIVGTRVTGRSEEFLPLNSPSESSSDSGGSLVSQTTAARKQRELEALALRRHTSSFWFVLFNVWCVLSALVFAPLPDTVYWASIVIDFEVYDAFRDSDWGEVISVLLIGPIYLMVVFLMLVVVCALKWVLIGKWTAGDRPYYTWFHFRWAALMVAFSSLSELVEAIAGTWLAVVFMRFMGAKVGKRVCFFGHGFEYDLLHIGDDVCIGPGCDVTAHTVENMVMKLEQVKFDEGSSCMSGSVVMPGGQMEPWSTLIEHSQVLKGEVVPQNSFFGGLPARMLRNYTLVAPAGSDQDTPRQPTAGSVEMASLNLGGAHHSDQPLLASPHRDLSAGFHRSATASIRRRANMLAVSSWRCLSTFGSGGARTAAFRHEDDYQRGPSEPCVYGGRA